MSRLLLSNLERYSDHGLFLLRLVTGGFLMWGTFDNVVSAERMQEFVEFLRQFRFPAPELLAPLSVYAQFACGALLVAGFLTRIAALVMLANFVVAVTIVHWGQDFRAQWPALILGFLSLYFALRGAGRLSLDRRLEGGTVRHYSATG